MLFPANFLAGTENQNQNLAGTENQNQNSETKL